MELIDKSPRKKIREHDAPKIASLHQPRYINKFEDFVNTGEEKLQKHPHYEFVRHHPYNWHRDIQEELKQFEPFH